MKRFLELVNDNLLVRFGFVTFLFGIFPIPSIPILIYCALNIK